MIKFTPNTKWLAPFIESAAPLVPIHKISHVHGYKVRKGLEERYWGVIVKPAGKRKYRINIKVWTQTPKKSRKTHVPSYISTVLETLAHELAHLDEWDHTPEHFRLTASIMFNFAEVLKKQKIRDTYARVKM